MVFCDDGKPCTDNLCDSQTGCYYPASNGTLCEDGNNCTGPDVCVQGACTTGPVVDCDDGDVCTKDQCHPVFGCEHTPTNPCDDANDCTDDSCQPAKGCVFTNNNKPCDDGSACMTGDKCQGGQCQGTVPLDCTDGNPCTTDKCNPDSGCFWPPNNSTCDDGNPCTSVDQCVNGACKGSGGPSCDDQNPCTDDSCDPQTGCKHAFNSLSCDDGDPCTVSDSCKLGSCSGGTPYCETEGCFIGVCLPLGDLPFCVCAQ